MTAEVAVVVGTRPEVIKTAPVLRALADSRLQPYLVHTGQHYDDELSGAFFRTLDLPTPDWNLGVGSGSGPTQTAAGLTGLATVIDDCGPDAVVAQGDTNAVLSAALATAKADPTFAHVEAGLRSYDRSMPEETNRVVADHVSDLLFAPTDDARENLAAEGLTDAVHVTGNTVVDACLDHAPIAARESDARDRFGLDGAYVLATIHRAGNTEDPDRLRAIHAALDDAPVPVVLPAHPRTTAAFDDLGLVADGSLTVCEPLDYLDFLHLLDGARAVVTDSGGVQEEASVLETPCLTVRPNTERPETVDAGVNELVAPADLRERLATLAGDDAVRAAMTGHPNLYGDGRAGERIVDLLEAEL